MHVLLAGYESQENLGLRSIAAFLESGGIRTVILPMQSATKEEILRRVLDAKPPLVGFSLIFQRMLPDYAATIEHLRAGGVDAHFTMGGHFATFEPQATFETIPGLDSIVRHEGELTMLELATKLHDRGSWPDIAGLAYRDGGTIRINPPRPLVRDLDSLPFPLRDRSVEYRGIDLRSIAASRGCTYRCAFCSITEFYRGAPGSLRRTRSPRNVVSEMQQLHDRFGTRYFIFQDDDMSMRGPRHRAWIDELLAELHRTSLDRKVLWRISCRVDDLDRDTLRRMAAHGLSNIYLGIESGCDAELQTINKGYAAADAYRAVDMLQEIGMPFAFGFMFFTPDTTIERAAENLRFLRHVADAGAVVNFTKMVPYAGTAVRRRLEKEDRLCGTIASPDYDYADQRVRFLQLFANRTFSTRNFDVHGLFAVLNLARFDALVARTLLGIHDPTRDAAVAALVGRANDSALDAMSFAHAFLSEEEPDAALRHWDLLASLSESTRHEDERLAAEARALLETELAADAVVCAAT